MSAYDDMPYGEETGTPTQRLLARIRNRFDYAKTYWDPIYKEGDIDMKYVNLDPWPAAEKRQRNNAVRPCLVMDEIAQNLNQVINSVRQNKRSVKVVPRGFGANDKTAEMRGDLIREIEYKSKAQAAYICGFENILQRSFGGWVIRRRYVNQKSFDQELKICRIPNPKSSYPDPDCKEQDFSDAKFWYLLDLVPRREYGKKYPKATITDFDSEQYKQAGTNWITEDSIQVAEYWEKEVTERKLYLVKLPGGVTSMFEDELPIDFDPKVKHKDLVLNERDAEQVKLKQYITNGLEILEENDEPGELIPIVWGTGKELYVDEGSGPKRVLVSLVRGARDPQMMVNYAATAKAEAVGMTPKTPYVGVAGQFHNTDAWQNVNTVPVAFLEYKATLEGMPGTVLGPPQRQPYEPMIEPLEIVQESARRSVQAGMGIAPLPTNAQKINDKSGVALQTIDDQEDRGTFHFIDNFEMMLEHNGRVLNDKIPYVYDAEGREIGLRNAKEEHRTAKINVKNNPDTSLTLGEHEITLSTGPSFQSERQQANEFVKTIVPNIEQMQLDPTTKAKFVALLIKTQNIGPMGDEMVELLDPKDKEAASIAQLQQQLSTTEQMVVGLKTENDKLYAEKQGKVVDNEYKAQQAERDRMLKLELAEITAKAQSARAREMADADLIALIQKHAHDAAMQAVQQQHEKDLAEKAAAAQQTQQQEAQPVGAQ